MNQISMEEKKMLGAITADTVLDYPTQALPVEGHDAEQEYRIPEKDRESILAKLWPFDIVPKMDDTMLCLHESKTFKVKDFKVIAVKFDRHGASRYFPILASPFYGHSGGTCLDWADLKDIDTEKGIIVRARQFKKQEA